MFAGHALDVRPFVVTGRSMVRLHTFGGLWVTDQTQRRVGQSLGRKPLALLALLARLNGRAVSRDRVLGLLWPEKDEEHARNALNQAVFLVRRTLGSGVLTLHRHELSLDMAVCTSDIAEFAAAVRDSALEHAVALYQGPFLDGFFVPDGGDFERWADGERAALRREFLTAVERLAAAAESRGDMRTAASLWQKAAAADPLSSHFSLALMRALASGGEYAAAIQAADAHAAHLRSELQTDVDPRIAALASELRTRPGARLNDLGATPIIAIDDAKTDSAPPVATSPPSLGSADPGGVAKRAQSTRRASLLATVVAAGTAGLLLAIALVTRSRAQGHGITRPKVLVAAFENQTNDPTLDQLGQLASDWVSQGLVRTGMVDVSTPQVTLWAPSGSTPARSSLGASSQAGALARRVGADLVVGGRYYRFGDTLIVDATLTDLRRQTSEVLPSITAPVNKPLQAVESLRQRIMGTLAARVDPSFERWATYASKPANFDAYIRYASGLDRFVRGDLDTALLEFRAAAALDSTFTVPVLWSVFALSSKGEDREADSVASDLEKRRASLAPWDRALLDYLRPDPRLATPGQYEAARRLVALAPQSEWAYKLALAALQVNRPHEALAALSGLDPTRGWMQRWDSYWDVLTLAHHRLHQYDAELADVRRFAALSPNAVPIPRQAISAFAALGNVAAVDSVLDGVASGLSDAEFDERVFAFRMAVIELRTHGHLAAARRVADRFDAWLSGLAQSKRMSCDAYWGRFTAAYYSERFRDALRITREWSRLCPGGGSVISLAIAAATLGDRTLADSALTAVDPRAAGPEAMEMTEVSSLFAAARVASLFGERERAVALLAEAVRRDGIVYNNLEYELPFDRLRGYAPFDELCKIRD